MERIVRHLGFGISWRDYEQKEKKRAQIANGIRKRKDIFALLNSNIPRV